MRTAGALKSGEISRSVYFSKMGYQFPDRVGNVASVRACRQIRSPILHLHIDFIYSQKQTKRQTERRVIVIDTWDIYLSGVVQNVFVVVCDAGK